MFDDDLRRLVDDMFESMYVFHGIGLAAPQIGIPKRITVIDLSFQKTPEDKIALINPEVVSRKRGRFFEEEGCLSLPDIREKVARAGKVKIRAQDLEGNWFEREAEDLLARAFQHEIDHLDGILFICISALKRDFVLRKIRKLQRAGES